MTLEIRPILEKVLGRWQFDFNPVVARALKGPGRHEGWEFEPGVRIGFSTISGWTGPLNTTGRRVHCMIRCRHRTRFICCFPDAICILQTTSCGIWVSALQRHRRAIN